MGAITMLLLFCTEYLRDSLLIRPHPAFWRLVCGCGLVYIMALAFAMFQDASTLRLIMSKLDPAKVKNVPLPERSYGENCELTYDNVVGAIDEFVVSVSEQRQQRRERRHVSIASPRASPTDRAFFGLVGQDADAARPLAVLGCELAV